MAEPALEDKITLKVLVKDDDPRAKMFKITVPLQNDFSDVLEVIQDAYWKKQQISLYGLYLYKANLPVGQVANAQLSDETLLPVMNRVASEWPSRSDVDEGLVHIIVRVTSKQVTSAPIAKTIKPPPPETELQQFIKQFHNDRAEFVEYVRTNQSSSSAAAQPKNFRKQQEGSAYISIGRPSNRDAPPIVLYHPVFGRFLKRLRSTDPLGSEVYLRTKQYFPISGETTRSRLHHLLGDALHKIKVNGVEADGVIVGPNGSYLAIMEMKNEIGMGSSDPSIQVAQSYMRYWGDAKVEHWLKWCCCPSILIGIAGPWMSVHGAIFLDRPVVQPLTHFMWVGEDRSRPLELANIARIFHCISEARVELRNYYGTNDPLAAESTVSPFPYLTHYLDSTTGKPVHFTYRKNLCPTNPEKTIFLAETIDADPRPIVVKFVHNYNAEAHRLLAEKQLAPQLLYDGTMHPDEQPGPDHSMIVMEYVRGANLAWLRWVRLPRSVFNDIKEAINLLHTRDFVFGDLRRPNIMVLGDSNGNATGKAMLIDFDWCGKHGEGRYPPRMNLELGWHKDVGLGAVMYKEHDTHMLDELASASVFAS